MYMYNMIIALAHVSQLSARHEIIVFTILLD